MGRAANIERAPRDDFGGAMVPETCRTRLYPFGETERARLAAQVLGPFTDAVVIGTGYNDSIGSAFRQAVLAITTEAASAIAGA